MGLIVLLGLMLAGCSQDDAEATPAEPVAITFDCTLAPATGEPATRSANGYAGPINNSNDQLQHTGFGMFASQCNGVPDLMYNQHVSYTFLAVDEQKVNNGYWSYMPNKYWPNDPDVINDMYFCAYAPYVDTPSALAEGTTGITSMSANNETTPYIIYTRAKELQENVDLLWYCKDLTAMGLTPAQLQEQRLKYVDINLHHALARVALNVSLHSASTVPTTTKVLIRRVTISGESVAKTGKLLLRTTGDTPAWEAQTYEKRRFVIDCDPEHAVVPETAGVTTTLWGVVDDEVRYIKDFPYSWQPDGLKNGVEKGQKSNVLSYAGHPVYLYLIPQDELLLTCQVDYTLFPADGDPVEGGRKATSVRVPSIGDAPLEGNTTYHLNLTINPTASVP